MENREPVMEHFGLSMKKGEIISVVGESGSGKTTVIRAVLGALPGAGRVTDGDILFPGESMLSKSKEEWQKIRGTKISMIFQDCGGDFEPDSEDRQAVCGIHICTHSRMSKSEAWGRRLTC